MSRNYKGRYKKQVFKVTMFRNFVIVYAYF